MKFAKKAISLRKFYPPHQMSIYLSLYIFVIILFILFLWFFSHTPLFCTLDNNVLYCFSFPLSARCQINNNNNKRAFFSPTSSLCKIFHINRGICTLLFPSYFLYCITFKNIISTYFLIFHSFVHYLA